MHALFAMRHVHLFAVWHVHLFAMWHVHLLGAVQLTQHCFVAARAVPWAFALRQGFTQCTLTRSQVAAEGADFISLTCDHMSSHLALCLIICKALIAGTL